MNSFKNEAMISIEFSGLNRKIPCSELDKEWFDVDFHGSMKVRFEKNNAGFWRPINAMNGYGHNCFDQIKHLKPSIRRL